MVDKRVLLVIAAVILLILVGLGVLGPSSFLVLLSPNPPAALTGAIVLTCADTKECREAVFPLLKDFTVEPESQKLVGYICSPVLIDIKVHNPLQLSHVTVKANGQELGHIEPGQDKNFLFYLQATGPIGFSKSGFREDRMLGIDAAFYNGSYGSEFLDKDKQMGRTISTQIDWKPTKDQETAYNKIVAFNESISACLSRASQSGENVSVLLNESTTIMGSAIFSFSNCDFLSINSDPSFQNLQEKCDKKYPEETILCFSAFCVVSALFVVISLYLLYQYFFK